MLVLLIVLIVLGWLALAGVLVGALAVAARPARERELHSFPTFQPGAWTGGRVEWESGRGRPMI